MPSSPNRFPDSFAAALDDRLRRGSGTPLITAYDEATGERTELSATTFANWVNKTASLLVDEFWLEPDDEVTIELPTHWLVPVFLGAAWTAGLRVTTRRTPDTKLIVTGPDLVPDPGGRDTLACSLKPFAGRFTEPVPEGIRDYGAEWPSQPDAFTGLSAGGDSLAWSAPTERTQSDLLRQAVQSTSGRLITDAHPATDGGVPVFLGPLLNGSVVLIANPVDDQWPARHEGERATDVLRATDS